MEDNLRQYIRRRNSEYRDSVLSSLDSVRLRTLIAKFNPFLGGSTCPTPKELVSTALESWFMKSQQTKFGHVLEDIATNILGNPKSATAGLDQDLIRGDKRFLLSFKSGGSWGNSQSTDGQETGFKGARKVITQNDKSKEIISVMLIFYGKCKVAKPKHADWKLVGQDAWYFLSKDDNLYLEIVDELAHGVEEYSLQLEAKKQIALTRLQGELASKVDGKSWRRWIAEFTCGNFCHDPRLMRLMQ